MFNTRTRKHTVEHVAYEAFGNALVTVTKGSRRIAAPLAIARRAAHARFLAAGLYFAEADLTVRLVSEGPSRAYVRVLTPGHAWPVFK